MRYRSVTDFVKEMERRMRALEVVAGNKAPYTAIPIGSEDEDEDEPPAPIFLDDLEDVSVPAPTASNVLSWSGTQWIAAVPPSSGGANQLNDLTDVTLGTPTNLQVLQYNGSQWVNNTLPSGSGGGATNLDELSDVAISAPTTGHTLRFNGTLYVNTFPLLDDASDVSVSGATTGHVLQYNGSQWIPATVSGSPAVTAVTPALSISPPLPTRVYTDTTNTNRANGSPPYWIDRDGNVDTVYYAYRDNAKSLRIAKRAHPYGAWGEIDLQTDGDADSVFALPNSDVDEHHTVAVAVDSSGYVHLIGLMHGDPLKYVFSDAPRSITGWNKLAGAMVASDDEDRVTYPWLSRRPSDGKLLFGYRCATAASGTPHSGKTYVNVLTTPGATPDWDRVGTFYNGESVTGNAYCAWWYNDSYILNAWVRRTEGDNWNTNLYCARSTDGDAWYYWNGSAWTLGKTLSSAQSFDPTETNARIFTSTTADQQSQAVVCMDSNGYPHIVVTMLNGGVNSWRHIYHQGGAWSTNNWITPSPGGYTRPALVPTASDGRVYAVVSGQAQVLLVDLTPGTDQYLKQVSLVGDFDHGICESLVDCNGLRLTKQAMLAMFPQAADTSAWRYHADNWKTTARLWSIDTTRVGTIVRKEIDPISITVVGQIPIPLDTYVEQTSIDVIAGTDVWSTIWKLEPANDLYVRLSANGVTDSATTTMDLVVSENTAFGGWIDWSRLQFSGTGSSYKGTPWVPISADDSSGLLQGYVALRGFVSASSGSGTIKQGLVQIGRMENQRS